MVLLHSLRARVTLGFAVLALTVAIVAGVAITSVTQLGTAIETILRENYRSVIACQDMQQALERQDSAARFASMGHENVAEPMLRTNRESFARAFEIEAHNVTIPGEGERVRETAELYREYTASVDRALAAPPGPARVEAYFRDLYPRFSQLEATVQRVLRLNQASMEAADRAARAQARRSVLLTLAVGAFALLLAIYFAYRLPLTMVRPVQTLANAARAVGAGDLDVAIAEPGVRELVPLAEAFHRMIEQLRAYRTSSLGELLAAKDLANATVRCLLDPVVVFGTNGDILLTNEAAVRTFGLEERSADDPRAVDAPVPEAFVRARAQVAATGEVVAPRNFTEAMHWRDAAGERYFLVRAAPLSAESDDDGRVIVVAQDVTRLRRIDALKSDMVATVSHEFKTPLTSLLMATHLLLEPGPGPLSEAQREIVTTARDDAERLRALVDELLDLVRIESEAGELHRVLIDPRRLLEAAVDAHRTIARDKGVALEVEPGEAIAPTEIDPEKLGIVLANLVSNAIRHTPKGGRVALGASVANGVLRLTVRDSGEGVAAEDLAHMLARGGPGVTRGDTRGGRHGLGLTIAQEIVLQHGGELQIESAVGRGSAFTVVLPNAMSG